MSQYRDFGPKMKQIDGNSAKWAWWYMPVIQGSKKLRQNLKFAASWSFIVRSLQEKIKFKERKGKTIVSSNFCVWVGVKSVK